MARVAEEDVVDVVRQARVPARVPRGAPGARAQLSNKIPVLSFYIQSQEILSLFPHKRFKL